MKHGGTNETRDPPEEIIVRNAAVKKQTLQQVSRKGRLKGQSKLSYEARGELSKKKTPIVDPRERQRRHVDRLFDLSNQLVEESFKTKPDSVTEHKQTIEGDVSIEQKPRNSTQSTVPNKPALQKQSDTLDDSQGPHTIETWHGSCSLVEMFASLQCCGINDVTNDDPDGIPSSTVKPELLPDSNRMSIPREISFSRTSETFDTSKYILLSEIEDNVSLRPSIMSRLRRGRTRTTSFPSTRVYVEPPHGRNRTRSLESRAPAI